MFLRNNALALRDNLRQIVVDTLVKCGVAVLQVPAFLVAPAPKAACIEFFSRKFHIRPAIIVSRLQRQNKIRTASPLNAFKVAV